jgi:hypothetical protein
MKSFTNRKYVPRQCIRSESDAEPINNADYKWLVIVVW